MGTAAGKIGEWGGGGCRSGIRAGIGTGVLGTLPAPASGEEASVDLPERRAPRRAGGDFNKWKPIAATRAGNGGWFADLELPPGEYRYAFRIDGKDWRVPEGVAAVDDEFGGKSAWLRVSRPR